VALTPGTHVGPYEVTAQIGAGGMGEVYRARDGKLGRDVAIKVVPSTLTNDPERLARFSREAQLLASLTHPNIAAIYHVEETADGPAIVMELVDGETLADRIARGPLPVDEASSIACEICDALQAAHEQGIIHRDLKPANIKIRQDGTVKVLDFGLAKLHDPNVPNASSVSNVFSLSPTMTSPLQMTAVGGLLGTAPYMSPEQIKGRAADKRSDIWAFCCVLFEMLAGRRPFEGDDMTDVVAAIVRAEPDWSALPLNVPAHVRSLIARCLERDRKRRVADIAVAQFVLKEPTTAAAPAATPASRAPSRAVVAAAAVAGLLLGTAVAAFTVRSLTRPEPPRVNRFELTPPQNEPLASPGGVNVIMSPDGSTIVYHGQSSGIDQLFVRRMNDLAAKPLSGTERATNPFFSSDGSRVGFTVAGQLKTISLSGGPPALVADGIGLVMGATWAGDTIVFAQNSAGLFRVPASGGRPQNFAAPDTKNGETDYRWPEALPDGRGVLYTIYGTGGARQARIAVRRLDGSGAKILVEGGNNPRYVSTGYILYATTPSALMAIPFDLARLETTGAAAPVQSDIVAKGNGVANFAIAGDGSLVYVLRNGATVFQAGLGFEWFGRDGKPLGIVARQIEGPRYPRLSPDGRRLAVTIGPSNQGNVWVIAANGETQALELTFKNHNIIPTWRPDGRMLAFASDQSGQRNVFSIAADGSTLQPTRLTTSANEQAPEAWGPDGRSIMIHEVSPKTGFDLLLLDLDTKQLRPWLQTEFDEDEAVFAPDGRWVSYVSNQTGRAEVWVRPFPGPGAPIRVSSDGGREPLWSHNGSELFYQSGRKLMVAEVAAREPEVRFKTPEMLFEGGFVPYDPNVPRTYDVAPDGRFLMIQESTQPVAQTLVIVQHFDEELKRLVPAN
jgi:eukaryotic-like serine/threonine-protein kinase